MKQIRQEGCEITSVLTKTRFDFDNNVPEWK